LQNNFITIRSHFGVGFYWTRDTTINWVAERLRLADKTVALGG
jgi:hypothetical protein